MVRDEFQELVVHELKTIGMRFNKLFNNHLWTNENYLKMAFKRNHELDTTEVGGTLGPLSVPLLLFVFVF